jgi:hypothetical protein
MGRPIAVIITGITLSPKAIVGASHAMDLRGVHYVRLTRRISFGGRVK